MANLFSDGNCIWIALMMIWSVIYGIGAPLVAWPSMRLPVRSQLPPESTILRVWWWWYQIVFNTAGVVIGWGLLYFLWHTNPADFNLAHAVAVVIAFLGVTGNLPQVTLNMKTLFPTA